MSAAVARPSSRKRRATLYLGRTRRSMIRPAPSLHETTVKPGGFEHRLGRSDRLRGRCGADGRVRSAARAGHRHCGSGRKPTALEPSSPLPSPVWVPRHSSPSSTKMAVRAGSGTNWGVTDEDQDGGVGGGAGRGSCRRAETSGCPRWRRSRRGSCAEHPAVVVVVEAASTLAAKMTGRDHAAAAAAVPRRAGRA